MKSLPDTGTHVEQLDVLVGEWVFEATVDGQLTAQGRTQFAWLGVNGFLIQRTEADPPGPDTPQAWIDNSPFPTASIYGYDDFSGGFTMLYSDARGVSRVYAMSLVDGEWKLWGQAGPEFHQRFAGRIDGDTIAGRYLRSTDGSDWETDFDIRFRRM